ARRCAAADRRLVLRRAGGLPAHQPVAAAVRGTLPSRSRRGPGDPHLDRRHALVAGGHRVGPTHPGPAPPVRGARSAGAGRAVRGPSVSGLERALVGVSTWLMALTGAAYFRSEERRVGKEGRARGAPAHGT